MTADAVASMTAALMTLALAIAPALASSPEAELLWQQGKAAFQAKKCPEAIPSLQRLVDLHPAETGYLEAHLLLGQCLLETGRPAEAIAPLKYFIEAKGRTADGFWARIPLGNAYLESKRFDEAHLVALELIRRKGKPEVPRSLYITALLLKSRALTGLGHDQRAQQALDAAKKEFRATPSQQGPLQGSAAAVELTLKTRACARLPGKGKLDEAQTRSQLERRSTCLLESAVPLRHAYDSGDVASAEKASAIFVQGYRDFSAACLSPPLPPGKRTKLELERYQSELGAILRKDCGENIRKAVDLLTSWKAGKSDRQAKGALPTAMVSQVNQVIEKLQGAVP